MNEITFGQYYPAKSFVHKLDPRIKITATLLYIVLAFFIKTFLGLGIMAVFLSVCIAASSLPLKTVLRSLKTVYLLLAITFLFNALLSGGQTVLVRFWFITITSEGIIRAVFMALRLMLLITGASVLTLTTTPITLTDGIERLLSPLSKLHFPAHEVAMMMTIALRFIPTLSEEADRIMKAQSARGASFTEGGLMHRVRAVIPLLVPLFIGAFRRADDLAFAMEARCYHGGDGRTRLHVLKFSYRDGIAAAVLLVLTAAILVDFIWLSQLFPFLANR